ALPRAISATASNRSEGAMDITGIAYFRMLAAYNRWANARLYAACLTLPPAAYEADRRGYFGSIGRTLNHILVGDRIWRARFAGAAPAIIDLTHVPYPDRHALWAARQAEDEGIISQ